MFKIEIVFDKCVKSGLDALDWRRAHGMTDGVDLTIDPFRQSYEVDEAFARQWFTRSEICSMLRISADDLSTEDVKKHPRFNYIARVEISPERAAAIFIKSRAEEQADLFDDYVAPSKARANPDRDRHRLSAVEG